MELFHLPLASSSVSGIVENQVPIVTIVYSRKVYWLLRLCAEVCGQKPLGGRQKWERRCWWYLQRTSRPLPWRWLEDSDIRKYDYESSDDGKWRQIKERWRLECFTLSLIRLSRGSTKYAFKLRNTPFEREGYCSVLKRKRESRKSMRPNR